MSPEAESIRNAFENLLRQNFDAARRALAQAQILHYGMRSWYPGAPEKDAIGNDIVYRDDGRRYSVVRSKPDGVHIRIDLGDMRSVQRPGQFRVYAFSTEDALELAGKYAAEENLHDLRPVGGGPVAGTRLVFVTYQHGRVLD